MSSSDRVARAVSKAPVQKGPRMRLVQRFVKLVEALLALLLVCMLVMVLGNVVLRYGFGTGIDISEELSRVMFIWITFIGAVLAMHEGSHLGMDGIRQSLPRSAQRACSIASEGLILLCCGLVFWGTWQQHEVNATTRSLVMGLPMSWVFGVGYITSIGIALVNLRNLGSLIRGQAPGLGAADHAASRGEAL